MTIETHTNGAEENDDIEARLIEFFDENYETLRYQGGHQLAPDVKNGALQQVLAYWRKLRDVAERVTDTEVRLTLPAQKTPAGLTFGINGVVDIVREENMTTMYDLKTHESAYVRANIEQYAPQLNVYAHIWQNLRQQELSGTAIISTVLPAQLRDAMSIGDQAAIERYLVAWNPVVEIPFDKDDVEATIAKFGRTVDLIEDHEFHPPDVATLRSKFPGQAATFATNVCRNCDARFSCGSYRAFALKSGSAAQRTFHQYFQETASDTERDNWLTSGLDSDATLTIEDFRA